MKIRKLENPGIGTTISVLCLEKEYPMPILETPRKKKAKAEPPARGHVRGTWYETRIWSSCLLRSVVGSLHFALGRAMRAP